jgi:hypothetical protein
MARFLQLRSLWASFLLVREMVNINPLLLIFTEKPQIRRRGNTISTITDASLMKHAIFFLSSNASESTKNGCGMMRGGHDDKKELYAAELHSRMSMASVENNEKVYVERMQKQAGNYSSMLTEARNGKHEDSSQNDVGDGSLDPKDLAKNGLPSACVFVAKY